MPGILTAAIIICFLGIAFTLYMFVHLLDAIICWLSDAAGFVLKQTLS
jgi:hypothetical protein